MIKIIEACPFNIVLDSTKNRPSILQKDLTKDSKGTPATATAKADANVNTQVGGKK